MLSGEMITGKGGEEQQGKDRRAVLETEGGAGAGEGEGETLAPTLTDVWGVHFGNRAPFPTAAQVHIIRERS